MFTLINIHLHPYIFCRFNWHSFFFFFKNLTILFASYRYNLGTTSGMNTCMLYVINCMYIILLYFMYVHDAKDFAICMSICSDKCKSKSQHKSQRSTHHCRGCIGISRFCKYRNIPYSLKSVTYVSCFLLYFPSN